MKTRISRALLVALSFLFVSVISCKKETTETLPEKEEVGKLSIDFESMN